MALDLIHSTDLFNAYDDGHLARRQSQIRTRLRTSC
jgi:hypothetical protein